MNIDSIKSVMAGKWDGPPSAKAIRYIDRFFSRLLTDQKILAKVVGNHGTYTVSIEVKPKSVKAACSCYIGKGGYCHHCEALAFTFLNHPESFSEIKRRPLKQVRTLEDLESYLSDQTLDMLLQEMKQHGITQKEFAECIGMNPRQLSAIKSSELRNRYFNELGATKLACLWVIEHIRKKG